MPKPMSRDPKFWLTPGAIALRTFLDKSEVSVPSFCEGRPFSRFAVSAALNGDRENYSVDFAFQIQEATNGKVRAEMWRRPPRPKQSRAA